MRKHGSTTAPHPISIKEAGSTDKERMRKHGSTNGRGFLDPQEDA